jgi:hypothetical protein
VTTVSCIGSQVSDCWAAHRARSRPDVICALVYTDSRPDSTGSDRSWGSDNPDGGRQVAGPVGNDQSGVHPSGSMITASEVWAVV